MRASLRRWSVLSFLSLAAAAPAVARAQQAPADPRVTTRVAAVFDTEVCACQDTEFPTPRLRDLVIVAVGWRFPIAESAASRVEVAWVPEVIPFLVSRRTADARLEVYACGPRRYCGTSLNDDVWTVTAYGAGLLPIGFSLGIRAFERMRVRTRVSAGAVQLSRPVPLAQGTKFNFVADGAATVEFRATSAVGVSVGLALNHVSNGGLGRVNLGMDSRMLEIGAVFGR